MEIVTRPLRDAQTVLREALFHDALYLKATQLMADYGGEIRQDLNDLAAVAERMATVWPRPRCILEIGTYDGGWPFLMSRHWGVHFQYVGVDNGVSARGAIREKVLASVGAEICRMCGLDSTNPKTPAAVRELFGPGFEKVDLLHIDGAHGSEAVLSDWNMYSPMVRAGGMVVMHDLRTPGILNIWNRHIVPNHKCEDLSGYVYQITHRGGVGVVWM